MILDFQNLFSAGTTYGAGTLAIADSITTAATNPSGNVIDLGPGPTNTALPPSQTSPNTQPFRDIGIGDDPALKLLVQVVGAFAGGTSLTISLQGAPDNGSGAPGAFTTWWSSPTYSTIPIAVGTRLMDMDMPRPPAGVAEPRFLRLSYTSAGTFSPAGLLIAGIVLDRHDQVYNATNNAILGGYPAGVTVAN